MCIPGWELWKQLPFAEFDDIQQSIDTWQGGIGAVNGCIVEVAGHAKLRVALKQRERCVYVPPELVFDFELEVLKSHHESVEV
jgi:hypothetical protein